MHTINMHEAKTNLSKLVEEAIAGEEVVIARAGAPMVRLVPVQRTVTPRTPGRFKGQISLSLDFQKTPAAIIKAFEGDNK